MQEDLMKKLLTRVMKWDKITFTDERHYLQIMSSFKYDDYEHFMPGSKYIDSLARWLNQFDQEERKIAYSFIKKYLIFFSQPQFSHLQSLVYEDHIKKRIIMKVSEQTRIPYYHSRKIVKTKEFKLLKRRILFLGLSDGARLGTFRRSHSNVFSHEQISLHYFFSGEKAKDFIDELNKDCKKIILKEDPNQIYNFQMVFLLDDFSASGKSYLRRENGVYKGKIQKLIDEISKLREEIKYEFVDKKALLGLIVYIMTQQSYDYLDKMIGDFLKDRDLDWEYIIIAIQKIPRNCKVNEMVNPEDKFLELREKDEYYDSNVWDKHLEKGGTKDAKRGFAGCDLSIVLHHNTPNNSIFHLWAYEKLKFKGLFPRVSRF